MCFGECVEAEDFVGIVFAVSAGLACADECGGDVSLEAFCFSVCGFAFDFCGHGVDASFLVGFEEDGLIGVDDEFDDEHSGDKG